MNFLSSLGSRSSQKHHPALLLSFIVCCLYFLLHCTLYLNFLADDALISLQYSRRLLAGEGLTWTSGAPVEGYSNLLWVLLCAALAACGVDLISAARILGLGFSISTIVALHLYFMKTPLVAFLSSLALVSSGLIAAWSLGGLEQPLVLAALAWGLVLFHRSYERDSGNASRYLPAGLCFAVLCLSRPDSPIFLIPVALFLFLTTLKTRAFTVMVKELGYLLAPSVLTIFGQLVFRIYYYESWVPNTALIKISFSIGYLESGLRYLVRGFTSQLPLLVLAVLFGSTLLKSQQKRRCLFLYTVVIAIWSLYLIKIGGDVNAPYRHFVVIILMLVMIFGLGLQRILSPILPVSKSSSVNTEHSKGVSFVCREHFGKISFIIVVIFTFLLLQILDDENRSAREHRGVHIGRQTAYYLQKAFPAKDIVMAVDQAGWTAFYTDYQLIDMLGLNDFYIARNPPKSHGEGWIGHEFGSGSYVLSKRPDIVIFGSARGNKVAPFLSGKEMQHDPLFHQNYKMMYFSIPGSDIPRTIWIRKNSPYVGAVFSTDAPEIMIPAQLFESQHNDATPPEQPVTKVSEYGKVTYVIRPSETIHVSLLLPKDFWLEILNLEQLSASMQSHVIPHSKELKINCESSVQNSTEKKFNQYFLECSIENQQSVEYELEHLIIRAIDQNKS